MQTKQHDGDAEDRGHREAREVGGPGPVLRDLPRLVLLGGGPLEGLRPGPQGEPLVPERRARPLLLRRVLLVGAPADLAPCPSCGGQPKVEREYPVAWAVQYYCPNCYEKGSPLGLGEGDEAARRSWNNAVEARAE